jgi:hypothetical protein
MASRGISAGDPCAGADRPAHHSPQLPDSPAGFLESGRGNPLNNDFHTYTRARGVAGLATLVHTPEVDQSESPDPPLGRASPVSLRAGVTTAGPLLFHRAIRTLEVGRPIDSGVSVYARFTQCHV